MAIVTRTLGPLHFEDLEPKRFEDLARQLIYDYKPWRRLEATGRAGADHGFDARGYEIVGTEEPVAPADAEEAGEAALPGADDRLWLVQCKRERSIGPTKLVNYLDDIALAEGEKLHGLIFTAACDFSKTARDKFAAKCSALGLEEWHLWGKAELEDRLFRPENDNLLFAYFGVSLTIRRRSQRADLRARLAMKRKANRLLGKRVMEHMLLRTPDAKEYPHSGDVPNFKNEPTWFVRPYDGMGHDGLRFVVRRHFAYLSDDGKEWDAAMRVNDSIGHDDPWRKDEQQEWELRGRAHTAWDEFPQANRAWLEVHGVLAFDSILDIDEIGDEHVSTPHVYAPFAGKHGPFAHFFVRIEGVEHWNARTIYLEDMEKGRVLRFPEDLRQRETGESELKKAP